MILLLKISFITFMLCLFFKGLCFIIEEKFFSTGFWEKFWNFISIVTFWGMIGGLFGVILFTVIAVLLL